MFLHACRAKHFAQRFLTFFALVSRTAPGLFSSLSRVRLLQNADMIGVVEGGRIVELGSHQELLDLDGRYAAYVRLQTLKAGMHARLNRWPWSPYIFYGKHPSAGATTSQVLSAGRPLHVVAL